MNAQDMDKEFNIHIKLISGLREGPPNGGLIGAGIMGHGIAQDFSKAELDEVVQKRDQEFLHRLKNLYWNRK